MWHLEREKGTKTLDQEAKTTYFKGFENIIDEIGISHSNSLNTIPKVTASKEVKALIWSHDAANIIPK